jgi:PAS domain S-box-containing protein
MASTTRRKPAREINAPRGRRLLEQSEALSALTALMRSPVLQGPDTQAAIRAITETATRVAGVARTGVWLLTPDLASLVATDLYDASTASHQHGEELHAASYPNYFRALEQSELIAAEDAARDPRTSEFQDSYFSLYGITATLDAPIIIGGTVKGAICLEQSGGSHEWTHAEQSFAVSLANLVALVLAQSERLRSESRLRDAQEQTRLILESVQEGIIGVDRDGCVLHMNAAATRMLAYTESDLLGQPADALFRGPDEAAGSVLPADGAIRSTLSDGQWRRVTNDWFVRGTGESFPVEYICAPMQDGHGAPDGVVLSFQDVTTRKRDERQREAEARVLEMISTGAPLPHVLNAIARGMEEVVSGVMASILLLDDDGLHLRFGAGPSLPDEYNRSIDGIAIGPNNGSCGTAMYREELVICADIATDPLFAGFKDYMLEHGLRASASMPVRDVNGKVVACCATYRSAPGTPSEFELTLFERMAHLAGIAIDRHRRERALRASEERFRHVAQGILDAVWDWNLQTDSVWWNHGIQTLFGHNTAELEPDARSWTNRIHADDCAGVVESIHAVIDGDDNEWEARYRFQRSDGSYAHVMDRGIVIRDPQGKAIRMIGGMTDITDRLALEEQLHQSQRLESIGQLTGGVAHDFNNLLTVILGNAELLASELGANPELASIADVVVETAQRGAELTQRLLAFARRQALEPRPTDVDALVAGMNGMLKRTLGEHIRIEADHGSELWHALVDPTQLESALLNLCLNARDAMPDGGILRISTKNVVVCERETSAPPGVDSGDYVLISVTDTGIGIAEENLSRVFEPFFTTKSKGKGTGLGLSMVYGFVTQSRGHVRIESALGRGTTVRMYLPRHQGDVASPADTAVIDPRTAPASGGHETVLLVEDDVLVRRYAREQLFSLGYRVIEADSGLDALERMTEHPDIDLLLTDVIMPGMGGRELADIALARRPTLRVLFTSGYTDELFRSAGAPERGIPLLSKPYRRAELARHVRAALSNAQEP